MDRKEFPQRKPNRLKDYDYSNNGVYFVTICTKDRKKLLGDIVGEGLCALPHVDLSSIGKEVEKSIQYIDRVNLNISVDHYVIMPNHVHLLVRITRTGGHGDPPLQSVIGQMKSYTSHQFSGILWQRSFHDHIVRDERSYAELWNYIDINPAKWEDDCFYTDEIALKGINTIYGNKMDQNSGSE